MCDYMYPRSGEKTSVLQWSPTRWAGLALDVLIVGLLVGFCTVFYSVYALDNTWANGVSLSSCTHDSPVKNAACKRQNDVVSSLFSAFGILEEHWVANSASQAAVVGVLWPLFGFDDVPINASADKAQAQSEDHFEMVGGPSEEPVVQTQRWMNNLFHCVRHQPLAYRSCEGSGATERICRTVLDVWMEPARKDEHLTAWVSRPPPWVSLRITLTPIFFQLDTKHQLEVIAHECTHIYEGSVDRE